MKIKDGFVLREVAGETVVLPSGDLNINAMITLNESAAFLWRKLEQDITEEELVAAVLEEFKDVEKDLAEKAVKGFIGQLNEHGFLA